MAKSINLLLLLAYCLLAIFLLNAALVRGQLRRVRARRRLPDQVFARTPCPLEVEVWNDGRGKAALRLEDSGPNHALSWFVGWLGRRKARLLLGSVVLPRRGRYRWADLRAVTGYPFGLFESGRAVGEASATVVLPALGWLHRGRFLRRLRGAAPEDEAVRRQPRRSPTAQAEFHGLRPFRPGDSPRYIHWRTSARRGELMTREYEDAPGQNLIVVLDTTDPRLLRSAPVSDGPDGEAEPQIPPVDPRLEALVSLAATLCWEWCGRRGDRLTLAVTGAEPPVLSGLAGPDHLRGVLETLAFAQPAAAADVAALADRLAARPTHGAALVVIAAGPSRLADSLARRFRLTPVVLDNDELAGCDYYRPPAP